MIQSYLWVGFISMLPLVEQKLAIPVGFFSMHLGIIETTVVATIGNVFSVGIMLWLLPHIVKFLEKHIPSFHRVVQKIFAYTRAKHLKNIERWEELFLVIFIAAPLPGTGGWMGGLLAFLFGLSYWKSMRFIALGLAFSGIIVAIIVSGGTEIFKTLNELFSPVVL